MSWPRAKSLFFLAHFDTLLRRWNECAVLKHRLHWMLAHIVKMKTYCSWTAKRKKDYVRQHLFDNLKQAEVYQAKWKSLLWRRREPKNRLTCSTLFVTLISSVWSNLHFFPFRFYILFNHIFVPYLIVWDGLSRTIKKKIKNLRENKDTYTVLSIPSPWWNKVEINVFALLGNRQSICMSANYVALKHLNPLSPFSTGSDLCNL